MGDCCHPNHSFSFFCFGCSRIWNSIRASCSLFYWHDTELHGSWQCLLALSSRKSSLATEQVNSNSQQKNLNHSNMMLFAMLLPWSAVIWLGQWINWHDHTRQGSCLDNLLSAKHLLASASSMATCNYATGSQGVIFKNRFNNLLQATQGKGNQNHYPLHSIINSFQ